MAPATYPPLSTSIPPIVADKSDPARPTKGHRALRRWRVSLPNRTYFITACTHERVPLFQTPTTAGLIFSHLHKLETNSHAIDLVASVVMPDHLHAVFTLRGESTLGEVMKYFRACSAQAVNRELVRIGAAWQRGYFDRLLRPDEQLKPVLHYLWHNPTPPGLHFRCRREVWEWFRSCVNDKPDYYAWLNDHP
jgi:putative transposase